MCLQIDVAELSEAGAAIAVHALMQNPAVIDAAANVTEGSISVDYRMHSATAHQLAAVVSACGFSAKVCARHTAQSACCNRVCCHGNLGSAPMQRGPLHKLHHLCFLFHFRHCSINNRLQVSA